MGADEFHELSTFIYSSSQHKCDVLDDIIGGLLEMGAIESVIYCQKVISDMLYYSVIEETKNQTDENVIRVSKYSSDQLKAWVEQIKSKLKSQPMTLTKDNHSYCINTKYGLVQLEYFLKKLKTFHHRYMEKFNNMVEGDHQNIYTNIQEWINKQVDALLTVNLEHKTKLNHSIQDYINGVKKNIFVTFDQHIKEYLQSIVSQQIIFNQILGDSGWRDTFNKSSDPKEMKIQSIEQKLNDELKKITGPFDAPFIDECYAQLYQQCYKRVFSTESPKEIKSSIQEMIDFDISRVQFSKPKLFSSQLQMAINQDSLLLLKKVCQESFDRYEFLKNSNLTMKVIRQNDQLSKKQITEINNYYRALYKSVRHFQLTIQLLKKNSKAIKTDLKGSIKHILETLERVCHEYRPFLVGYMDLLTVFIDHPMESMKNDELKEDHHIAIEKLTCINRILDSCYHINQIITDENLTKWMSSETLSVFLSENIDDLLNSYQVWLPMTEESIAIKFLTIILDLNQIKINKATYKRRVQITEEEKIPTVSQFIELMPEIDVDETSFKIINRRL